MRSRNLFFAFLALTAIFFATVTAQTVIQVATGTDGIAAAYASAASGDIIELTTSGGLYVESAALIVTGKDITIRAASGLANKPVWVCTAVDLYGGLMQAFTNLTVDGIVMDGTASSTATVNGIITKGASGLHDVKVLNCTVQNFATGIYGSSSAQVNSIVISNCIFKNLSKYGLIVYTSDVSIPAPGSAKSVVISNSTFSNIPTYAVQVEASDDVLVTTPDPVVTIDHVTFYNTPRFLTHYCNYTTVQNCIFSTGTYSYYIYGNQSACSNSLYWSAPPSFHTAVTSNILNADPLFTNAAAGDFTLLPGSPAYHAGTDGKSLGDLRWTDTPLPVELSSFKSSVSGNGITLEWNTATEVNSYMFEVERKFAASQWNKIGEVQAAGSSNSPKSYAYADKNLGSGKYAYRLKMVDRDGSFTYSQTVESAIGSVPRSLVLGQNFPNPFNPQTLIEFTVPVNGMTSLEVYNVLGEKIATLVNEKLEAGSVHRVQFDGRNYPSGFYFYTLRSGNSVETRKMLMMK